MTKKVEKTEAEKTEADLIWDEIKDKNIDMFALPDQVVSQYCKPAVVEPSKLYLRTSASCTLPSLEAAVGKKFTVELLDKYVVVARVTTNLIRK